MSFTVAFRRCVFRERGAALDQPVADPPYGEKVDGIRRVGPSHLMRRTSTVIESRLSGFDSLKVLVDLLLAENIPQARGEQVQYLEFLGVRPTFSLMFLYEVLLGFSTKSPRTTSCLFSFGGSGFAFCDPVRRSTADILMNSSSDWKGLSRSHRLRLRSRCSCRRYRFSP